MARLPVMAIEPCFDFEPYYCSPRLLSYAADIARLDEIFNDETAERQNFYLILATLQKNRLLWQTKQKEIKENLGKISDLKSIVWVEKKVGTTLSGKCEDGRNVSSKASYLTAEFDDAKFRNLNETCRQVLDPLALEYPLSLFMRRATFHKIESAIAEARADSEKLKVFISSMVFFLRRLEPAPQTKEMIQRWTLWCVDALVKLDLSESDFKFLLKTFSSIPETVFEDENFDFGWIPNLCQFPDLKSSSDPLATCDLVLVSYKIICESFVKTIKSVSLQSTDVSDEFHVINLSSCTKCEFYISLMKQMPTSSILRDFEKRNQTPAQYFSLLSYSWKLIRLVTASFHYTENVSFSHFFCLSSEIVTSVLETCSRVLEMNFKENQQALDYYNELFLETVKRFLVAKSPSYLQNDKKADEKMHNTLGVWKYFEKMDFRKLSNESIHGFISFACLRSSNCECTCLENIGCVSSHVQEFVQNFLQICSYASGYVQCEKDGVSLLQSLVNLTQNADDGKSRSGHIVDFVASSIWEICFASSELQKTFCAHGYQLLKSLTSFHPHTIDYFITWTSRHTNDPFIVSVASKIFQYIKLDSWKINPSTIESLSKFLELPSESSLNPVSRFLLDRINWRTNLVDQNPSAEDISLKLEVVRIVAVRYFDSVTESTERKLSSFFNDNNTKLTEKGEFALWCWQLIPNLDIQIPFGHAMPLVLSQVMSENLCFMHFLPLWLYKDLEYHPMDSFLGFRHLHTLLENEFYIPVLSVLDNILYKYGRDTSDSVRNLFRIFDKICYGDRTVIGASNNANTKLLASMVVNLAHKHLDSVGFQVVLKALLIEHEFAYSDRLMLILDQLCNFLFFKQKLQKVIVPKLTEIFMKFYTANYNKNSLDNSAPTRTPAYQPLLPKPDFRYVYLNYACLMAQINFERITKFWTSIVEVAKTEIDSSSDELIYRAKLSSTINYNCSISVENLAIQFCSKLILQTEPNSFIYLHLWRQMMLMYFCYDRSTNELAVIGDRFFKKLIGFSPVKKMAAAAVKGSEVTYSSISKKSNYRRGLFLNTCSVWLLSSSLKGAPISIDKITYEHDIPNMMDLIFDKKQSFFRYMEFNYLDIFTESFFKSISAILNPDLKVNSSFGSGDNDQTSYLAITYPVDDSSSFQLEDPVVFRIPPYLEAIKSPYDSIQIETQFEPTVERIVECLKHISDYTKNALVEMQNFEANLAKFRNHVKEEYSAKDLIDYMEIACTNMFRKTCSGPALIEWKYSKFERKPEITDLIRSEIFELDQKFPLMYMRELENFVESAELLTHLLFQLVKTSNQTEHKTEKCENFVNGVFFTLVESAAAPKFLNFAPFSAIFENCLQILGPNCVRNANFCSRILKKMVEKNYLVPLLSSYFDVDQSIFVEAYCQILQACSSGSLNAKMSANLLKKFDFTSWLVSNPSFADMKKLVLALLNYFMKIGRNCSAELQESVPMEHFLSINSVNSETLIEICFPGIFEIECQTVGLCEEFYVEFLSCCQKDHSAEHLPDIMNSIMDGLNTNEKVCFKTDAQICRKLLKPEILACIRTICFQYLASLGSHLDFTTSVYDLELAIENSWDILAQIFDNFWLENSTTVRKFSDDDCSFFAHAETFVQCVNRLQICFHKIRPALDVGYCGARYKNALNFLIERIAILKIEFSQIPSNEIISDTNSAKVNATMIAEYFESVCWSIFMPSFADLKNLHILFGIPIFHTLALQIFVSVNWSSFYVHQSNVNLENENEVLFELLSLTLKFYFKKNVLYNVFLVYSEWNVDQETSSAEQVTMDDAIGNLEECNWTKLETENLRLLVSQWEFELRHETELNLTCSENSFVRLFFSVAETSFEAQNPSSSFESKQAVIGKPFVFVETLCRLIFKEGNEKTLENNVTCLIQELTKRYSVKFLRVSLLASIFEQSTKVSAKNLKLLTSAVDAFLSSRNLSEKDFLWFFEAVCWSITSVSYLCQIAELVIDKYFAINARRKSSVNDGFGFKAASYIFEANWDQLQIIINNTSFSNYKTIFETCAKNGHTFLLYLLSKSTKENSISYFIQSIVKLDLMVLADQNLDHKLVVVYYRLLNLNREADKFPVGSSATKLNNPAKAIIHLLMQVCDVNLFDKIRSKLGLHASSHFSMDFRIISKCLLIYILRTLPLNLREGGFPKHMNLLDSLRRLLTTFPSSSVVDYELLIDLCICTDSHQPVFYMLITNFYSGYRALAALLT